MIHDQRQTGRSTAMLRLAAERKAKYDDCLIVAPTNRIKDHLLHLAHSHGLDLQPRDFVPVTSPHMLRGRHVKKHCVHYDHTVWDGPISLAKWMEFREMLAPALA